ncbi:DUF2269 family protein [Herbiconiux ginsengi]|uniref:Predicted integral membrane protein n=1 Tax=Herbiconiux ginsengi TaxID=381665 RepID=A0A1H3U1G1_9MICO|nr:DUF2269 family protein [Herbiconiux ginsengi]SDZ56300.1 Predicted integral membrane protein [Herbiconiux ginsengi]
METLFSILHVVSAVFIVGPIAIMPMAALRSLRTGDTQRAMGSAKSIRLLSYLSLIIVITGFGVMGMADPKYNLNITTPWVLASLILYAVALLATLIVTVPAFQHSGRQPYSSAYARAAASSGIATLCLIAVVILMVWKP